MKTRMQWLQGSAQLAADGLLGAVETVEGIHLAVVDSIARFLPFGEVVARSTGFVYARLRDAAQLGSRTVGGGFALLQHDDDATGATVNAGQLAWLSALNGAIGDRLEERSNPLALDMRLCRVGQSVDLFSPELGAAIDAAGGTVYVFAHGLGMNDLQWRNADGVDFGQRLQRDRTGLALHLRYNSGRRISANGRDFSDLLQLMHKEHGTSIRRLILIGHSMGGLVCRSACAHAQRESMDWASRLSDVVCLGSPHLGAPLERLGDSLSALLASTRYTRTLAGVADTRSAGVKDLRHGWSSDLDRGSDDHHPAADVQAGLPGLPGVRWFLAAATLGGRSVGTRARWLGDGLVPVPSALGQHERPGLALRVPAHHRQVFTNTGHMELLTKHDVYEQLIDWIGHDPD